jgi:hypothetical protein
MRSGRRLFTSRIAGLKRVVAGKQLVLKKNNSPPSEAENYNLGSRRARELLPL